MTLLCLTIGFYIFNNKRYQNKHKIHLWICSKAEMRGLALFTTRGQRGGVSTTARMLCAKKTCMQQKRWRRRWKRKS